MWAVCVQLFDQNVTRVAVQDGAALSRLVTFSPPLPAGVSLSGTWLDNSTLLVTFRNVPISTAAASGVAVGRMVVAVEAAGNLRSAFGQSDPANCSIVVGSGSWYVLMLRTINDPVRMNVGLARAVFFFALRGVAWLFSAGVMRRVCPWTTSLSPPFEWSCRHQTRFLHTPS